MTAPQHKDNVVVDEEAPISVPDSGDTGEGGKLKMIVQLVKKCLGVKDIANMYVLSLEIVLKPVPDRALNVINAGGCRCRRRYWNLFPTWSTGITLTDQTSLLR